LVIDGNDYFSAADVPVGVTDDPVDDANDPVSVSIVPEADN